MKKFIYLLLVLGSVVLSSCEPEDGGDTDTSLEGVWTRLPGPSGDRTDLAIGGIEGEPENRVYMCEKEGSSAAGLYKGVLNGNIIVWDADYGLPNTSIKRSGNQLEFDYSDCGECLVTYYEKGNWAGDCGQLENTSIKLAVGLNNSDNSSITIKSVTVDGYDVPLQLLNSTTTEPDCTSPYGTLTLHEPIQFDGSGNGYYSVNVTYSAVGADGYYYTKTDTTTYFQYYFDIGCNKYQVILGPTNKFMIAKMN